jgi:hypothetical protein
MSDDQNLARPELRPTLTSRERQALINDREAGWMRGLQAMAIDVGHHPFLSAGDSEIVEARFFQRLRLGTPFERAVQAEDVSEICDAIAFAGADTDRAIVAFSPDAAVLGAFVSTSSNLLPKLPPLVLRAGYELGVMSLDAGHGVAIQRTHYSDSGVYSESPLVLFRVWGAFVPQL